MKRWKRRRRPLPERRRLRLLKVFRDLSREFSHMFFRRATDLGDSVRLVEIELDIEIVADVEAG